MTGIKILTFYVSAADLVQFTRGRPKRLEPVTVRLSWRPTPECPIELAMDVNEYELQEMDNTGATIKFRRDLTDEELARKRAEFMKQFEDRSEGV